MNRLLLAGVISLAGLIGCHGLTNQDLPSGTNAPSFYSTPAGARSMRNGAINNIAVEIPHFITDAGLLTDELQSNFEQVSRTGGNGTALPPEGSIDERILPELTRGNGTDADKDYGMLQAVRGSANQALGALTAYDTASDVPVLRAELYALSGYAEILLADFFCSGVPLSTFDFQQDFTYQPSSTTQQVYQDALAKEDSALALAGTSDSVQRLAHVLMGRALLDLGEFTQASQMVASVPDGFQYQLAVPWTSSSTGACGPGNPSNTVLNCTATVSDREGFTGLPFLSSADPRLTVVNVGVSQGNVLYFPARYAINAQGYSPFAVADWIEARLIQAEAALHAHDNTTWLSLLNHLRTTATVPGQTATPLDMLADPGAALTGTAADSARVALMFQERAYWLFLTGHRQGDLRRLLRQYSQYYSRTSRVYPSGSYSHFGAGQYGDDVTIPVPASEYSNPLFHGCRDRAP